MADKQAAKAPASQDLIDNCLANAVARGDVVNFRYLFHSASPLRADSSEHLDWDKYAYVRPEGGGDEMRYAEALRLLSRDDVRAHLARQLEKRGPVQLPSDVLMLLADNAVRLGKCHAAAQAYELLRIRRRMQDQYFEAADEALDADDVARAVRGYRIATGLDYDYAAFPEPMPAAPNHQTKVLMLHAEYPRRPQDALPFQPVETHVRIALEYLLLHPEAAERLEKRPLEQRVAFIEKLVRATDPAWDAFLERYKQACALAERFGERLEREAEAAKSTSLADEIAAQQEDLDPRAISAALLGRCIEEGEWWQYLKELAYQHPAAALFVSRQWVSKDIEIVMPRYAENSELVRALGIKGADTENTA